MNVDLTPTEAYYLIDAANRRIEQIADDEECAKPARRALTDARLKLKAAVSAGYPDEENDDD